MLDDVITPPASVGDAAAAAIEGRVLLTLAYFRPPNELLSAAGRPAPNVDICVPSSAAVVSRSRHVSVYFVNVFVVLTSVGAPFLLLTKEAGDLLLLPKVDEVRVAVMLPGCDEGDLAVDCDWLEQVVASELLDAPDSDRFSFELGTY